MARLNAAWLNFSARGQAWYHFWQDAAVAGVGTTYTTAGGAIGVTFASGTSSTAAGVTYVVSGGCMATTMAQGGRSVTRVRAGRASTAGIGQGTRAITYQEIGIVVAVAMAQAARNINIARGGKGVVSARGAGGTDAKVQTEPGYIYPYPPDMQGMAVHGRPGKNLIQRAPEHERTHS